jgi:hypothetical protein
VDEPALERLAIETFKCRKCIGCLGESHISYAFGLLGRRVERYVNLRDEKSLALVRQLGGRDQRVRILFLLSVSLRINIPEGLMSLCVFCILKEYKGS